MDEILKNIPAVAVAVIGIACIGATELINRISANDVEGATKIVISSIVGVLMSFAFPGLNWYYGLILGLAGSGLITGLSKINGVQIANQTNSELTSNDKSEKQHNSNDTAVKESSDGKSKDID